MPVLGRIRRLRYSIAAGATAIIAAAPLAVPLVHQANYPAIAVPILVESRPSVMVERFERSGPDYRSEALSQGISDAIIEKLAKSNDIVVLVDMFHGTKERRLANPSYALQGRIQVEGAHLRSTIRLVRRADGAVIWANNYNSNLDQQGLASVATSLAKNISPKVERSMATAEER
ncbi:hypothetical protein [Rhizobium sp. P32RR-XVIII]|uniref:hypothetical protein n=1 Tax=Rhizobium sp. P32RR-XVIII TaxID=2726738 RepID=UPI0014577964|nr:hypothetical protein [Rhizobium sp. P32RR-XVIII]